MDDEPIPELGNMAPASYASMPSLSFMRSHGEVNSQQTIPDGYAASTEIALMTILGFTVGSDFDSRSWFEALGGGLEVTDSDLCLRCNLITHCNSIIESHCGHYPDTDESHTIIKKLNEHFGEDDFTFHSFGNFRNLLIVRNCWAKISASPPHRLLDQSVDRLLIRANDLTLEERLNRCITESRTILRKHIANGIAIWAPGRAISFPDNIKGSVVAGVNVVKGIGRSVGMSVIDVPGATGDEFTDYSAKLNATLQALKKDDFVLLHIEATDEASHERAPFKKVRILETIDRLVLSPLLTKRTGVLQITVQGDHATSSLSGKHLSSPVTVINYTKNE